MVLGGFLPILRFLCFVLLILRCRLFGRLTFIFTLLGSGILRRWFLNIHFLGGHSLVVGLLLLLKKQREKNQKRKREKRMGELGEKREMHLSHGRGPV